MTGSIKIKIKIEDVKGLMSQINLLSMCFFASYLNLSAFTFIPDHFHMVSFFRNFSL